MHVTRPRGLTDGAQFGWSTCIQCCQCFPHMMHDCRHLDRLVEVSHSSYEASSDKCAKDHIVISKHTLRIRERHSSKLEGTGVDSILIISSIHGDDLSVRRSRNRSPQGVTKSTGLRSLADSLVRHSVRKIAIDCLWQWGRRAPMRQWTMSWPIPRWSVREPKYCFSLM